MGNSSHPYDQRSDLDKIRSQWTKASGLHERKESSAAIVRCATAAEIAANLAIRREFERQTDFDEATVDSFLVWANGLSGKMHRLLFPLRYRARTNEYKELCRLADHINETRNGIVHRGTFASKKTATEIVSSARKFIETLVGHYEPGFKLRTNKAQKRKVTSRKG